MPWPKNFNKIHRIILSTNNNFFVGSSPGKNEIKRDGMGAV
jgi:hypothetical protein